VTLHKLAAVVEGDMEELLAAVSEKIRANEFSSASTEDDD
jgi:hypothetical protein